jgi:branched-chain amino acid aminotransferase
MSECYHSKFILNDKIESCGFFHEEYLFRGITPYEVLKVIKGIPLFFEDHFLRLSNTLNSKNRNFCLDDKLFKKHISTLVKINNVKDGNIKFLLNYYQSEENCLLYFIRHKYPTNEQYINGVQLSLYQSIRENPNAKLINKALTLSAKEEKSIKGVYEVLLENNKGYITEGSMSNVFFIKGATVYTPPLKSVLPGITRKHIILTSEKLGITVFEKEIHKKANQNIFKELMDNFLDALNRYNKDPVEQNRRILINLNEKLKALNPDFSFDEFDIDNIAA